jgi:hypothetical protein
MKEGVPLFSTILVREDIGLEYCCDSEIWREYWESWQLLPICFTKLAI